MGQYSKVESWYTAKLSCIATRRLFIFLAGIFLLGCTSHSAVSESSALETASSEIEPSKPAVADELIKVTFLGTGTPVPNPRQFGQSILIEAGEAKILVDCGRGCAHRLWNIDPDLLRKTDHLFITHMHSDHTTGIADLFLNGWNLGRTQKLKVYGPEGVDQLMHHLRQAYEQDVVFRADRQIHDVTRDTLKHIATPIAGGQQVKVGDVTVTAITVDHHVVSPAYGYRIDYQGLSVVVSGDTAFSENLIAESQGVDLLIHEVMSPALEHFVRSHFEVEVANDIVALHTLAPEAGEVFRQSKPRMAVYTHLDNNPKFESELRKQTRVNWDGPLVIAKDLMSITVGKTIEVSDPESGTPQ